VWFWYILYPLVQIIVCKLYCSSLTFRICPSVYFPSKFLINSVNGGTVVPKSTEESRASETIEKDRPHRPTSHYDKPYASMFVCELM